MIDLLRTYLGYGLAFYTLFWLVVFVVMWLRQHERRMLWERRLDELTDEIYTRQLWAEERRWDLRVLLEKWQAIDDGFPATYSAFGEELERQAHYNGLTFYGGPAPGYPPAERLTKTEIVEMGRQIGRVSSFVSVAKMARDLRP